MPAATDKSAGTTEPAQSGNDSNGTVDAARSHSSDTVEAVRGDSTGTVEPVRTRNGGAVVQAGSDTGGTVEAVRTGSGDAVVSAGSDSGGAVEVARTGSGGAVVSAGSDSGGAVEAARTDSGGAVELARTGSGGAVVPAGSDSGGAVEAVGSARGGAVVPAGTDSSCAVEAVRGDSSGKGERRRELAAFLRSRRERIRPDEVGFAPGGRRRTPGLRREEVAQLAGVGVTWYTWLEQGRDINVSAQVLEAISRTLRLDRSERNHLYTLAGLSLGPAPAECTALPKSVQRMLDKVSPYPALVLNTRYDVLAFNDAYCKVVLDMTTVPVEERNLLWLTFVSPEWRCSFLDGESMKFHLVAAYRAALADHLGEQEWRDLTERLLANSAEFAQLWERYDVAAPSTKVKLLENERLGLLRVEPANFWLTRLGQFRATVYTAVDEATEEKLRRLVDA